MPDATVRWTTLRWDFSGSVALISGGTRGIGAAISAALLDAGAEVIALYQKDADAARRFVEQRPAEQRERLTTRRLDVTDPEAIAALFASLDKLQIVVNNAGIRDDALVGMMSHAAWRRVLQTNLEGAFLLAKQAVRKMMPARHGRIISITSPSAMLGIAGQANYAAAKAGLIAMSRSLAREVARRGITVNCVCPGVVETDLVADLPAERLEALRAEVPLQRFARAEEVASAVLYLASDEASYITGTTLMVTGGLC